MLLLKNSFIKIRKSLGRFFSLIFIVALGSAFFAGVRETSFDMLKTADAYFDSHSLMDFRIVSTMGLTDDDVLSLEELEYVQKVVPGYSFETEVDGNATKVYGYLDEMNTVSVVSGRLLENENEILVEEGTYNVGDVITFDDSALDFVKNKTYTVVGTVETPMYIYENKGISTVGDGKLDTFMYIMSSNFTIDYYTEVYLTAKDSLEKIAYQDDYLETVDRLNNELMTISTTLDNATLQYLGNYATIEYTINEGGGSWTECNTGSGNATFHYMGNELENVFNEYKNALDKFNLSIENQEETFVHVFNFYSIEINNTDIGLEALAHSYEVAQDVGVNFQLVYENENIDTETFLGQVNIDGQYMLDVDYIYNLNSENKVISLTCKIVVELLSN